MKPLDAKIHRPLQGGASFELSNRVYRVVWQTAWCLLARWTPPPLHGWRRMIVRLFGGSLAPGVRIYGSTWIWYPPNLVIGRNSLIGPGVRLYNQGSITLGDGVVISQGAHICASSHDINDPNFQLILKPIRIEDRAWIAADAFVGPGVIVGEGAVLGARGALFRNAEPWGVYLGNPAIKVKERKPFE